MRASAIATHMHKTEVWSPVVISGVQSLRTVELNGPLGLKLQADSSEFKLVIQPPQQQKDRILGLHTLPATYTCKFQWQQRTYGEPRLRTIHNYALEHTQQDFQPDNQQNKAIRIEGTIHKVNLSIEI